MMTLTTPTVSRLTGATARQLRYWAKTGLLKPSARDAGYQRYAFGDVVAARTVVALQTGGASLQHIRQAVAALRARFRKDATSTLAGLTLMTDGTRVYLVTDQRQIIEVLSGQTVMHVVHVGRLIQETQERAKTLRFEWVEAVRVAGGRYTLVISHDPEDEGYTVQCRELPGAIEQGETPEQAVAHGKAAIESVLAYMRKHGRLRRAARRVRS